MLNLNFLEEYFEQDFIDIYTEIVDLANVTKCEETLSMLKSKLLFILQNERVNGFKIREISPSGNNFIVIKGVVCLLFNIFDVNVLIESGALGEGELSITNFQWLEEDNLVVFDLYYIVHDKNQKGICHFSSSDFFVYFTELTDGERGNIGDTFF